MAAGVVMMAVLPSTTNYKLNSFGFGSGGTAGSGTTNYSLEGISGEVSGQTSTTTNFQAKPGFIPAQTANVPTVTLTNPASYYNKLHFVIDQQNNPSDTKYALSISTDNFVSDIRYVKNDLTVGSTLTLTDYKLYSSWGGASGNDIIGLLPNTTYWLKAKALQGSYSESGYGPASTVATVGTQLSFDIDVANSDTETSPPYSLDMGSLLPNTVITSAQKIWIDLDTNGQSGGKVYVYTKNAGLKSTAVSYTISSATTADLSLAAEGFGAQSASATQTSGGPLLALSPYNGAAQAIGVTDTIIREIYSAANPITGGRGSFLLKAKSSSNTPAAADYTEIFTAIASASF